jgi:phage terminase large subunit
MSLNPELEEDETYQRFIVDPPPDALVIKINHSDNPWFPDVLKAEMEQKKAKDPDGYLNIWEGFCRKMLEGAIYANELRKAQEDGRITKVPYDATKLVDTWWDLGWADNTSIWFTQNVGFEIRIIDFYQNNLLPLQHYTQVLKNKNYDLGTCHLPHDARAKQLGTGRSTEELLRSLGFKVKIVPQLSILEGINAARTLFNACWFDEKRCSDGLHSLRRYRYDIDPDTKKFSKEPLHDVYSHAADAFRYMGVGALQVELNTKFGYTEGQHTHEYDPYAEGARA